MAKNFPYDPEFTLEMLLHPPDRYKLNYDKVFASRVYSYTQVEMVRGNIHQISWIPSKFAVLGKVLKVREKGVWEDGWKVVDVGDTLNADYVVSQERDYGFDP